MLRKFEQKQVLDGIETQLRYEPTVDTRNRKQLDPNEIADWEGFDVGDSDDFAVEVKLTARNKKLIKLMAARSKNDGGKRYSLEEIKQEFCLQ